MAERNLTYVTEFVLLGISNHPEWQIPLFLVVLIIYLITAIGNLGIITITNIDSLLKAPMYFFLRHLAFINLGNSTTIAPKMLVNLLAENKTISYYECASQTGCFSISIIAEIFMLTTMAYDQYMAIWKPLIYRVIISREVCIVMVILIYTYSFIEGVIVSTYTFSVSYCSSNVINHFYCDHFPLLALSCSDTHIPETIILIFSGCNLTFTLTVVLVSYSFIILAIVRIRSSEGRWKAFSTCTSHLMAVTVFYGTLFFMYLLPQGSHSLDTDKMASVVYTLVIPMLNPLIYSLKNKEVKDALKRLD
ncbi:olfactory receptor 8J2-like [Tachyglossus aculeatus]|uniref:olfactory receptor 8J2-like n=1 Tax=Tachyglossus aculeatus TaxID=9261 RepID=UPI0018F375B5|nr:olfactory receptor 8J2-like [Tachyglossus aculeatus]